MSKRSRLLVAVAAGALLAGHGAGFSQSSSVAGQAIFKHGSEGNVAMTKSVTSLMLQVPGGSLYYEVRGTGPLLLLIAGGATDAGIFADLSRQLAGRYTVVAYDPRGNSRSVVTDASQDQNLDVHGDDAARLIEALGQGPALVFGSSGGAQIGLNLAARHPERVRMLVAHEPPCLMLLDDPSQDLAKDQDVYDTFHRDGVEAAAWKFFQVAGMSDGAEQSDAPPPAPSSPEAAETFARINGNMPYFFAHGLMPLSLYRPDAERLRSGKVRVVVGVGETTVGQTTHRTGSALAEKLGGRPFVFPGDHIGYVANASAFADTLDQALTSGKGS
jgi:pimeloyl-ACP methyl ester carboxylesterase